MSEAAEPPQNVRLVHPDGEEVPLEVVYVGRDDAGQHRWVALLTGETLRAGMQLRADVLPAHTTISFDVIQDEQQETP